jgi:hypothetical protein
MRTSAPLSPSVHPSIHHCDIELHKKLMVWSRKYHHPHFCDGWVFQAFGSLITVPTAHLLLAVSLRVTLNTYHCLNFYRGKLSTSRSVQPTPPWFSPTQDTYSFFNSN